MDQRAALARRMFDLVEPIGMIPYFRDEPEQELAALGLHGWDGYFAGRAAPLGVDAPAELVHALFYSFAPGEAARHLPRVWEISTPAIVLAARRRGCVRSLHAVLGADADHPRVGRAAELLLRAARSAPLEARPMHAALRALPVPDEPLSRLWCAADLLREHRGDGHVAALLVEGVGGTEAHVLRALSEDADPHTDGRLGHLPTAQIDGVVAGLAMRGLVADGHLTTAGRETKQRVEDLTDRLAADPYDALTTDELAALQDDLQPIAEPLARAIRRAFGQDG